MLMRISCDGFSKPPHARVTDTNYKTNSGPHIELALNSDYTFVRKISSENQRTVRFKSLSPNVEKSHHRLIPNANSIRIMKL